MAPKPVEERQVLPPPQAASSDAPEPKKFLGFPPLTWAKILPLGFMFFCILFNYTILRDTKVCTRARTQRSFPRRAATGRRDSRTR